MQLSEANIFMSRISPEEHQIPIYHRIGGNSCHHTFFLVIFEFCRVTISGETSCPGEINGCFLGVHAGLHMSVRSTFISQRKLASVTLIDIKLCDVCQPLFWFCWHESGQA